MGRVGKFRSSPIESVDMQNNKHRILKTFILSLAVSLGAWAQTGMVTTTSGASYGPVVAPDSIASAWGTNLATATTPATGFPLPSNLGNTQITITDSTGAKLPALLYLVSPGQINFLVPANTALGRATLVVTSGGNTVAQGALLVSNVAPAIFSADATGKGVPAAQVLRVTPSGVASVESPFRPGATAGTFVSTPINVSTADRVYLILYGTGIRRHSLNPVKATIGGISVPVLYAGAQSQYPGLDQVNLGPLPQTLAGKGEVDLILTVDGVPANVGRVAFQ